VSINLPFGKGMWSLMETKIDTERLVATINDLGYTAFPEKRLQLMMIDQGIY